MSEDLIARRSIELPNGVSLTYPSDCEVVDYCILLRRLVSSTVPPRQEFITLDSRPLIGGEISSFSKKDGSSQAS